jgi:hypothetical protein
MVRLAMPDKIDLLAHMFRDHMIGIVIAIRAGENYDAEFHNW